MGRDASAQQSAKLATHRTDLQGPRIELVVDGEPHPFCARNRLLRESGRFWRGYGISACVNCTGNPRPAKRGRLADTSPKTPIPTIVGPEPIDP